MNKIRQYISTFELTRGFFIALLASLFIYMEYWGYASAFIETLSGLLALYLLMQSNTSIWFFSGFFTGIFWFWWISLSFNHYHMAWAVPIVVLAMGLLYAVLFGLIAYLSDKIPALFTIHDCPDRKCPWGALFTLTLKALGLLMFSCIHPFGFDWFKPELIFVNSYIGIEKWQFAVVLSTIGLSIWRKQFLWMSLVILAYQPHSQNMPHLPEQMALVTTHTSVEDKWNKTLHKKQFKEVLKTIDLAIKNNKKLIIFPESVFPVFLNYDKDLIDKLKKRAEHISIVAGGLYRDGKIPYNSAYIFANGKITVANKVLLVPFGESNPLPDFLSDWVNKVFYDGAVDYIASKNVTDYTIDGTTYRNAICFEATSEKLYEKGGNGKRPKNMIVLSNNGWFTPSVEPTLQKLLLLYYSKKYDTTIYHAVNMSKSYIIYNGKVGE